MFKQNFIRLCADRGESPSSVCIKCGLSNAAFSCWTDDSVPRRTTLLKFANYFGVPVESLTADSSTPQIELHIQPPPLSPSEQEIIDLYRISPDFRAAVDSLVRLASPASKNAASSISKEA